jgi:hypothetical protein
VREFVRLTLGQPIDTEYGVVDPSVTNFDGPWYDRCTDDEDWFRFPDESESEFSSWSNCDWGTFFATKTWRNHFDDADEFVKGHPQSAGHRLNMARALRPIFDRAAITNWWMTEDVLPYVKALLAIDFREAWLSSKQEGSVLAEVA